MTTSSVNNTAAPADDARNEATKALQKALDRRDNGGRSAD